MFIQNIILIGASALMLKIAYDDFRFFKIQNNYVAVLIIFYLAYAISKKFDGWNLDAMAGVILFVLGFFFWQFKLMGAGDAKLYFPLGLFISWNHVLEYTIYLIIFSTAFFLLIRIPVPLAIRHTMLAIRIDEIRAGKAIPYAVPMVFAALVTLFSKFI